MNIKKVPNPNKKIPLRYSKNNPPTTENIAQQRIDHLETEILTIEASLDHNCAKTFSSEKEYVTWHNKAIRALAHMKKELVFLKRWLVDRSHSVEQSNMKANLETFFKEANNLATEIGSVYQTKYTSKCRPLNQAEAKARLDELVSVLEKIKSAFTEINTSLIPISEVDVKDKRAKLSNIKTQAKMPLKKLRLQVDQEIALVKEYLRQHSNTKLPTNWKHICLKAIDRAVEEGFVLTNEETGLFNLLRTLRDS